MLHINVNTLTTLAEKVESGHITNKDLDAYRNLSSKVEEKVREYHYTGKTDSLSFTLQEAFRAVVYKTKLMAGEPVMFNGEIVPSAALEDTSDIPVIYSRPVLFDSLKVLYWKDQPLQRLEFPDGSVEKVNHSPLTFDWDGREYQLLCEVQKKSFYWPTDTQLPVEIKPWLTNTPQDRTTLATGLKRQGIRLESLAGIKLPKLQVGKTDDLGVWVMNDKQIKGVSDELGCSSEASQVTIWFTDGSYFKGTILSASLSKMKEGIYGGIKRPESATDNQTTTRGSIMDNYILVPWTPSMNRQQTDYAGIELPVRAELPGNDLWMKAITGFPGYINQFNDRITSSAGRVFQKCRVKGFAGKVAVEESEKPVQFIIRGPKLTNDIVEMAWLFNPSLPVHTDIMKVQVQTIKDESMDGNLILLNTHKSNENWVADWYMAYAGRDCDGDGFTLSTDKEILKSAKHWSEMGWMDTTAFKSEEDTKLDDGEMTIRTATERIRLFSSKIGIYDKCARRIIRQDKSLMSDSVRYDLTEAIQRSISAQKKNSGADKYQGYWWLLNQLPTEAEDWLFENVHDDLDFVGESTKDYLTKELFQRKNEDDRDIPLKALSTMLDQLVSVKNEMPYHYDGAVELLNLTQYPTPKSYRDMKDKGRQFWAKYQARADKKQLDNVLQFITQAKCLWSKSSREEHGLSFTQCVRIITHRAEDLIQQVEPLLVIGAMLNYLNVNLLGHVLTVENLKEVGLINGLFIQITHTNVEKGMVVDGDKLKRYVHSGIRPYIKDCEYMVDEVYSIGETTIIKVKEMKS
ncbi:MAG: hypothetical protein H8D23_25675 [Candidatus Brocadiales bacterium]|nr:hypothetical protein [Candidatus Brocadiales bacterium]